YLVSDEAIGRSFYDMFEFNNIPDPTHGRVTYVDKNTAIAHNITHAHKKHFILRTDSWTTLNSTVVGGRESARLRSKKLYDTHVLIADIRHMPEGCATWPALWEFGPDHWPNDGEIDILEGVNDFGPNTATLHTNGTVCTMDASTMRQQGTLVAADCDVDANFNQGCPVAFATEKSYGPSFNKAGGGWYALEKTDAYIKVWFWSRHDPNVPLSVKCGSTVIDTSRWGLPQAHFTNDTCDIAQRFKPANILINLTLCGDWAGNPFVWPNSPCAAQWPVCNDYVDKNPAAFKNAFFDFKALRVY
ncbi:glycoside hydrolase family 16 protein, partial [Auriculariales sp. MPI-PUGE-AT-0066]